MKVTAVKCGCEGMMELKAVTSYNDDLYFQCLKCGVVRRYSDYELSWLEK